MVKGVNKMVLDLPQPESESFERVIFFVRPEASARSEGALEGAARRLLEKENAAPPVKAQKRRRLKSVLTHVLTALAGAGLTALLGALLR